MIKNNRNWIRNNGINCIIETKITNSTVATITVTLIVVNLVGGFLVTHKMLEMFRKKDSSPECWHYVIVPSVVTTGDVGMLSLAGVAPSNLTSTLYLASELGYVAGIAQMLKQQTVRLAVYADMGSTGMGCCFNID